MRIAIWHNLPSGGGKRALNDFVRGLLERGHYLESWCPPTANQSYLPLNQLITEHVRNPCWEYKPPTDLISFLNKAQWDIAQLHKTMNEHSMRCAEEIKSKQFDVLFAHPCGSLCIPSIGRYLQIPKVHYVQEPERLLYEAMPTLPWIALPPPGKLWWTPNYLKRFLKDKVKMRAIRIRAREQTLNIRYFDKVLVNSLYSRESILRAYGVNSEVCYLGVDTQKFVDRQLAKDDYVVGLGTFTTIKNIKFVVEALAEIKEARPRLIWIGNYASPSYFQEIKQLAQIRGVEFEPKIMVSDEELVNTLNRARMLVCTPRLEPFGYGPLEANACGLPVVATREGGLRETIIDDVNGLLVDYNPKAVARAIERLLYDQKHARQLGENGRKLVEERWSLSAAIDRVEQKLVEACQRKEING